MSTEKEQLLLRALNTGDTAIQPQDLSRLITLVTPRDVHAFPRLGRTRATALTHEWVETTLVTGSGNFVCGAYVDGGIPGDLTNTHTRKDNKLMSIGRVAKATGLVRAIDTLNNMNGQQYADAFALELAEKMVDFIRTLEYFIFNGDVGQINPQQMRGLVNSITTNVTNLSGAVLSESDLFLALKQCYDNGGLPTAVYCRPSVAAQIASFGHNKVNYIVSPNEGPSLIAGAQVYKYMSPFGSMLDVIPVRTDFLPSGNVLILTEQNFRLAFASAPEIDVMDIPISSDAVAKLIKTYVTLEDRAESHSAKITGVLDSFTLT